MEELREYGEEAAWRPFLGVGWIGESGRDESRAVCVLWMDLVGGLGDDGS